MFWERELLILQMINRTLWCQLGATQVGSNFIEFNNT